MIPVNRNRQAYRAFLLRRLWKKTIHILAGSLIQGCAMGVFLFPHSIPSGSGAGLAMLLNYWFHLPLSIGFWLVNISFLLFAVHYLGRVSAFGTIMVITITSVSVNFFEVYVKTPFGSLWINLLVGSVILGTGISILFRERVTNGGIGFVALAIAKARRINPGTSLFIINVLIFSLTAIVIDWKIIIQALICQWISTRVIKWLHNPSLMGRAFFQLAWRKK